MGWGWRMRGGCSSSAIRLSPTERWSRVVEIRVRPNVLLFGFWKTARFFQVDSAETSGCGCAPLLR